MSAQAKTIRGLDAPIWTTLTPATQDERDSQVRVQWLGTAGFRISYQGFVVLIDPYVTRASLGRCVTSPLWTDVVAVDRYVDKAHAIIVGHTHFDHALDVPFIAKRTGAKVFGSRSCASLCRNSGLGENQVHDVESDSLAGDVEAEVGPFHLRFIRSEHSRLLLGSVPFAGDIADCDQIPLRTHGYRCGAVFAAEITVNGKRIFHVGSANLVESAMGQHEVDLALVCVAGWTTTHKYPERVMRALNPGKILLSHWDNFFRPMHEEVRPLPAMRTSELVERLAKVDPKVSIGALSLLGEIAILQWFLCRNRNVKSRTHLSLQL